jgi:hypothetical protein
MAASPVERRSLEGEGRDCFISPFAIMDIMGFMGIIEYYIASSPLCQAQKSM